MQQTNVRPEEIKKFGDQAQRWWDPNGEFRTLHQINPARVGFIESHTAIRGSAIADIGCGGGILSEELARLGGRVLGIDLSEALLDVAELHALETGVDLRYERISAESLAEREPSSYDIVTCMEMLEHVPDPAAVIKACGTLVKPGGWVFVSTLNRNPKAYLLAIVGAEYLLRMIPKGTHRFDSFIRPAELCGDARSAGLDLIDLKGIAYDPLTARFRLGSDIDVNYLAAFRRAST